MSKPITEWGTGELRAMFAGLPDGTLVAVKGDNLVVANISEFTMTRQALPDLDGDYLWTARPVKTTFEAELKYRGDGNRSMVVLAPAPELREDLRVANSPQGHRGEEVKAALVRLANNGYRLRNA